MGTKLNPGKFDCHANAAADEPLFTLLARDETAPGVVRQWASRFYERKCNKIQWDAKAQAKYDEAMLVAEQMEAWRDNRDALAKAGLGEVKLRTIVQGTRIFDGT